MCRHTNTHAHAQKLAQENHQRRMQLVFISGNYIGYSSVVFYFEMTWIELVSNTQADVRRHLPAVNMNCINIKSQRSPCQGQPKADENPCYEAAAQEMESGDVVVACLKKTKNKTKAQTIPDFWGQCDNRGDWKKWLYVGELCRKKGAALEYGKLKGTFDLWGSVKSSDWWGTQKHFSKEHRSFYNSEREMSCGLFLHNALDFMKKIKFIRYGFHLWTSPSLWEVQTAWPKFNAARWRKGKQFLGGALRKTGEFELEMKKKGRGAEGEAI